MASMATDTGGTAGREAEGPVVAVVPARMGSSRLPGKMLCTVGGQPLLGHLLDRLALCRRLDGVIVATSTAPADDALAVFCRDRGVACFRGSEDDVLGRLAGALASRGAGTGVLVFGDCPLIDPAIVDGLVDLYRADGAADFIGNDLATTYPPGMEAEVFRAAALTDAARRCDDPAIREHGTLFVRRNPGLYRLRNVEAPPHLRRPELEIEVDAEEDLAVVGAILGDAAAGRPDAGLAAIIAFLDARPDLAAGNRDVHRRWKAFRQDAEARP